MNKDKSSSAVIDSKSINVFNQEEVEHYCELFGCSELDLRWAISCVGNSMISVEAFLSMNQRKSYT